MQWTGRPEWDWGMARWTGRVRCADGGRLGGPEVGWPTCSRWIVRRRGNHLYSSQGRMANER